MPTVLRSGPYRFFFFSGDREEPQHVHVRREWREAKIWIAPILVADGGDYRPAELGYHPDCRRESGIVTQELA